MKFPTFLKDFRPEFFKSPLHEFLNCVKNPKPLLNSRHMRV